MSAKVFAPSLVMRRNRSRTHVVCAYGRSFRVIDIALHKAIFSYALPSHIVPEPLIRAVAISDGPDIQVLVSGDDKIAYLFSLADAVSPRGSASAAPKRLSEVLFSDDNSRILCADRFGDVFSLTLPLTDDLSCVLASPQEPESEEPAAKRKKKGFEPKPRAHLFQDDYCILGHCAMLLSMAMSPDSTLLATGDRDERVRVSRYPHSYDIQSFCMGHTGSVFGTVFCGKHGPETTETLVTGAADGSLRLWDALSGRELDKKLPLENESALVVPMDWSEGCKLVAVVVEGTNAVLLYRIVQNSSGLGLELKHRVELESEVFNAVFVAENELLAATATEGLVKVVIGEKEVKCEAYENADTACEMVDKNAAAEMSKKYVRSLDKRVLYGTEESEERRAQKLAKQDEE